jgi:hypothetical protein
MICVYMPSVSSKKCHSRAKEKKLSTLAQNRKAHSILLDSIHIYRRCLEKNSYNRRRRIPKRKPYRETCRRLTRTERQNTSEMEGGLGACCWSVGCGDGDREDFLQKDMATGVDACAGGVSGFLIGNPAAGGKLVPRIEEG